MMKELFRQLSEIAENIDRYESEKHSQYFQTKAALVMNIFWGCVEWIREDNEPDQAILEKYASERSKRSEAITEGKSPDPHFDNLDIQILDRMVSDEYDPRNLPLNQLMDHLWCLSKIYIGLEKNRLHTDINTILKLDIATLILVRNTTFEMVMTKPRIYKAKVNPEFANLMNQEYSTMNRIVKGFADFGHSVDARQIRNYRKNGWIDIEEEKVKGRPQLVTTGYDIFNCCMKVRGKK